MQKKFATQIEGQTKKEKRRRRTSSTDRFFQRRRDEEITLSKLSLQKKSSSKRVHTQHACTHTHTFVSLSLSLCKLSEHCCCCCCCCCELSGVFSSSLSLSFLLVRKKKGEEKRKTTEDHPKTVESNAAVQIQKREIKFLTHILIFLQEDVKEDSLRESKRGYTHPRIPLFSLCDRLERL